MNGYPPNMTDYTLKSEPAGDWQNLSRERHPRRHRAPGAGFSILSFDGGGYRGYASLLILRRILMIAQPEGKIFPYLYFDLICGTSTGGLIAILLAVLHLDIDTAIEVYTDLGRTLFANSWREPRFWLKDSQFNHRLLRRAITDIVGRYGRGRTLMYEPKYDRGCSCFVTVMHCEGGNGKVILIKSYEEQNIPHGHKWGILDAAMATSAAPTYFKAYRIERDDIPFTFEDAGVHGANNPTEIAWEEGQKIDRSGYSYYIVSIGTGPKGLALDAVPIQRGKIRRTVYNMFNIHRRARELAKGFAMYATDTAIEQRMVDSVPRHPYFRFNPPPLGDIDLANHTAIQIMQQIVETHFTQEEAQLKECATLLTMRNFVLETTTSYCRSNPPQIGRIPLDDYEAVPIIQSTTRQYHIGPDVNRQLHECSEKSTDLFSASSRLYECSEQSTEFLSASSRLYECSEQSTEFLSAPSQLYECSEQSTDFFSAPSQLYECSEQSTDFLPVSSQISMNS